MQVSNNYIVHVSCIMHHVSKYIQLNFSFKNIL